MTTKSIALLSAIFSMFVSSALYADAMDDEKAMQLAASGVQTKNATGENQTTMVDANGNLKIMTTGKDGKPVDPNAAVLDGRGNNAPQQPNAMPE